MTCGQKGSRRHNQQEQQKIRENSPLSTNQEKILEYLSMTLDYMTIGKVKYRYTNL